MLLHAELDKTDKGICNLCNNIHYCAQICTYILPLHFQRNAGTKQFSPFEALFGWDIQVFA